MINIIAIPGEDPKISLNIIANPREDPKIALAKPS